MAKVVSVSYDIPSVGNPAQCKLTVRMNNRTKIERYFSVYPVEGAASYYTVDEDKLTLVYNEAEVAVVSLR